MLETFIYFEKSNIGIDMNRVLSFEFTVNSIVFSMDNNATIAIFNQEDFRNFKKNVVRVSE